MLVMIISECRRGAWPRTRRIVDAFLERVGERTWRGRLSDAGLSKLRVELTAVASRNTSVAASVAHGHHRFELEWIVGSTRPFGPDGQRNTYAGHAYDHHLEHRPPAPASFSPLGAAIALAGLWHDVGKANPHFQRKLNAGLAKKDPVRHEILSCLAFHRVVDEIGGGPIDSAGVAEAISGAISRPFVFHNINDRIDVAPIRHPMPLRLVSWLVVSHHRLLDAEMINRSIPDEGLFRLSEEHADPAAFDRPLAIALDTAAATGDLARETASLLSRLRAPDAIEALSDWRAPSAYGRLALILADRHVSRRPFDATWHGGTRPPTSALLANYETAPGLPGIDLGLQEDRRPKQTLDEHLAKVAAAAPGCLSDILDAATGCPSLAVAGLPKMLRARSSGQFAWQDAASDAVRKARRPDAGFFGEVIAGTGSGKTRGCPKILAACGPQLRYVLCLPLRSLTLQAGADYRDDLGLNQHEVATIIGDPAIKDLFDRRLGAANGSETAVTFSGLLDTDLPEERHHPRLSLPATLLKHFAGEWGAARFLAAPILVSTIDQMMDVADARRTSYILPALRLAGSDLILDEVDSYDAEDQVAIGRLVYLAGLFGRKVLISSATVVAPHAAGLFAAYKAGYEAHAAIHGIPASIDLGVFSDAGAKALILRGEDVEDHSAVTKDFRIGVAEEIGARPSYRRGAILPSVGSGNADACFGSALLAAHGIHRARCATDKRTGRNVSVILVRFAHIQSCVEFAQWLARHGDESVGHRAIVYHSAFPLIVRDRIEAFLDAALKRKPKDRFTEHPLVRGWLGSARTLDNILFVIATAVEEIGRDHDFDGAIIEPTSLQSIIQCAGRIERHRLREAAGTNVYLLPSPMRVVRRNDPKGPWYANPGPEGGNGFFPDPYRLPSPQLQELVSAETLAVIDARPRLVHAQADAAVMSNLEHRKLDDFLNGGSPYSLRGFHEADACAWLSRSHANAMRFRRSSQNIDAWLDPTTRSFRSLDDDADINQSIRCSKGIEFDTLRLLDLEPVRALQDAFPERAITSMDPERRKGLARRFLRLSLPLRDDPLPYDYDVDLGAHIDATHQ